MKEEKIKKLKFSFIISQKDSFLFISFSAWARRRHRIELKSSSLYYCNEYEWSFAFLDDIIKNNNKENFKQNEKKKNV